MSDAASQLIELWRRYREEGHDLSIEAILLEHDDLNRTVAADPKQLEEARRQIEEFRARDSELYPPTVALPKIPGYRLLGVLGQGGMGVVYRAEKKDMRRPCAVKAIPNPQHARLFQRFQNEIIAAAQLDHPNIVKAYTTERAEGNLYLVMELVPGTDLATFLRKNGPPSVEEACSMMQQAAAGLAHAHARHLVHRDIKPSNLMRTPEGVIKILDMGLARSITECEDGDSPATQSNEILGTYEYMAPEQATSPKDVDGRADIYSLGCTFFFLLTGRSPFRRKTAVDALAAHKYDPIPSAKALRPEVPDWLESLLCRMMAKDPAERIPTMEAVADALTPLAASVVEEAVSAAAAKSGALGWDTVIKAEEVRPIAAPSTVKAGGATTFAFDDTPFPGAASSTVGPRSGARRRSPGPAPLLAEWAPAIVLGLFIVLGLIMLAASLIFGGDPQVEDPQAPFFPEQESQQSQASPAATINSALQNALGQLGRNPTLARQAEPPQIMWEDAPDAEPMNTGVETPGLAHLAGHTGPVRCIAFSDDGQWAATGSDDQTLRLWNLSTWKAHGTLTGFGAAVHSAAFSPDGRYLAWGGDGFQTLTVCIWDLPANALSATVSIPQKSWPARTHSVAFSRDGKLLAAGGSGPLVIYDLEQKAERHSLEWQTSFPSYVSSVAFSDDGASFAAACHGGGGVQERESVKIWAVANGNLRSTLVGDSTAFGLSHDAVRGAVIFSPDDSEVLRVTKAGDVLGGLGHGFGGGADPQGARNTGPQGTLMRWNVARGTPASHRIPGGNAFAVAWPEQNRILVAAAPGGGRLFGLAALNPPEPVTIHLWDSRQHQDAPGGITFQTQHNGAVISIALTRNAKLLATGGMDNQIKLWDADAVLNTEEN